MPLSEIWLRMAAVKGVNGARAREYLAKTADSAPLDPQALLNAVLTPRQHQRYRRCSPSELESARRWLAQPGHHLLAINDARYPRRRRSLSQGILPAWKRNSWRWSVAGNTAYTVNSGVIISPASSRLPA